MSTRCNINFYCDGEVYANVYVHSDGYPEGMEPELQRFFDAVKADTADTRFNDPEYLAAKYVVWKASQLAVKYEFVDGEMVATPCEPLDFLGIGVCNKNHGDIEYIYEVRCDGNRPKVTWSEA